MMRVDISDCMITVEPASVHGTLSGTGILLITTALYRNRITFFKGISVERNCAELMPKIRFLEKKLFLKFQISPSGFLVPTIRTGRSDSHRFEFSRHFLHFGINFFFLKNVFKILIPAPSTSS